LALALLPCAYAQEKQDVREFVRPDVFPSSFAELAASYDASVVPQLIDLLESPDEKTNHTRIVILLGVVGDERAADALISFIEKPVENIFLTDEEHEARNWAIQSLGYLANRNVERALNYLIEGLTPSAWRLRNVQGIASWTSSYEEYDQRLSTYALFGLARSGHPAAGQALRSLQQAPTPGQARFRNGLDDTLNLWLGFHEQVAARGLAGAFEHDKAEAEIARQRLAEETRRAREEREEAQSLREAQNPR
jgi:HEAT repeat protein